MVLIGIVRFSLGIGGQFGEHVGRLGDLHPARAMARMNSWYCASKPVTGLMQSVTSTSFDNCAGSQFWTICSVVAFGRSGCPPRR
jgi:hypothetical protein